MASAAEGGSQDLIIDFESSGVMKDLLGKTTAVAKSFLFLSTFAAFVLEAFGVSPTEKRDYGAVTWRLVVVLFLLWNYQMVFGSVVSLMDRIDREVAPPSTWQAFKVEVASMRKALEDLAANGQQGSSSPTTDVSGSQPSFVVSWAYEALIACVELVAEGVVFLIRWMSRILTATLFILGPLALVASIPRASRTGTRWFQRFVTIASWPVFASVMLSVMVTLAAQGTARHTYLECLVAALVMLVTSLSTPTLASHVVGGALQNFAAIGFEHTKTARGDVGPVARSAASIATGAHGRVASAVASVAGRFTGDGPAQGGSGGSGAGGAGRASLGSGSIPTNPPTGGGTPRRGAGSGGAGAPVANGPGAAMPGAPPPNSSKGPAIANRTSSRDTKSGARDPGRSPTPGKGGSDKP
ncbi:MAG TPA: hypothetical protein VMK12_17885 [Anaeromyxobacteraceae bacterium]|nr:hypothetical protein [Anaeromyxobacteraceae bacterium]